MPSRTLQTPAGEVYETEGLLDYGEHAEIWWLKGRDEVVAKVYLSDGFAQEEKLRAMLAAAPEVGAALAWPTALLYENGRLAGYVMPLIPGASEVDYAPDAMRGRARDFSHESTRDALQHAAELARSVAQIHQAGHTIGNFSPGVLVWRADGGLGLIGTDSFCIRAPDGSVYAPGTPPSEYIAPELRGLGDDKVAWSTAQDAYAFAQHLRHLLRQHEPNLAGKLRRAFRQADTPEKRASAAEWGGLLEGAAAELVTCAGCGNMYAPEMRRCPRCGAAQKGNSSARRRIVTVASLGLLAAASITVIAYLHGQGVSREASKRESQASHSIAGAELEPGRQYAISLGLEPGSPRRQILLRGDDRVLIEAREGSLVATWKSGSAVLVAGEPGSFEQKPGAGAWVEGWRDVQLTFKPTPGWDAIYRVRWADLGLKVREGAGIPRLSVAAVARESPASDGALAAGERIVMPELRMTAEPSEAQFQAALEKLASSAVTLRVFSGEPTRLEGYIASGEFRPMIAAGEYLKVAAVGSGSRAQLAGLRPGDVVTTISGQSTRLLSGAAIEKMLNRNVALEVFREKQVRTVVVARDKRVRAGFSGLGAP